MTKKKGKIPIIDHFFHYCIYCITVNNMYISDHMENLSILVFIKFGLSAIKLEDNTTYRCLLTSTNFRNSLQ